MDTQMEIPITDANDNIREDVLDNKLKTESPRGQAPISRSSIDNNALMKTLNNNNNDIYTSHTSVNNLPHLSQYHKNIKQLGITSPSPKSGAHPIGYQYVPVIVYSDGSMRPIDMAALMSRSLDTSNSGSTQLAEIASKIASSMQQAQSYQLDPADEPDPESDSSTSSNNDASPSSDDTGLPMKSPDVIAVNFSDYSSTKCSSDSSTKSLSDSPTKNGSFDSLLKTYSIDPLEPIDLSEPVDMCMDDKKDMNENVTSTSEETMESSIESSTENGTDSLVKEIRGKAQSHYAEKGEIVYKCDCCESAFSTPVFLQRHRKLRHLLDDKYPFQKSAKQICLPSETATKPKLTSSILDQKIAALSKRAASLNGASPTLSNGSLPNGTLPVNGASSVPHQCLMCGLAFTTSKDLTDHVVQHSRQLSEEQTFPDLTDHMKEDLRSEAYSCNLCLKSFHTKHQLKSHIKAHGIRDLLVCGSCPFSTSEFDLLYQHLSTHPDGSPVKCKACVRTFKLVCHLKFHVRHVHPDQALDSTWYPHQGMVRHPNSSSSSTSEPLLPDAGGLWRCTYCYKVFEKASNLQLHVRVHTGEKPYICSYCNHRFTLPGDLKRHTRIHTGEKPYMCMYCDKRFNRHDNLKSHAKVHMKR